MSSFERKLRKLKRDPRQFFIDTRQYKFVKRNFNIELAENTFFDLALNSVENFLSTKSDAKNNLVLRKNLNSEYEDFDLAAFKKDYPILGHDESYLKLMRLWKKYPWSIKLIKAQ